MKSALLEVDVQWMFSQLVHHLLNGFYMLFAFAFGVDENVVKVHYHENVELLC